MYSSQESPLKPFDKFSELLGIEEMTEMLGISKRTAYKLIKQNEIPSKKIGRTYKIFKNDVLNYLGFDTGIQAENLL